MLQDLADDVTRVLLKMAVLGPLTQALGGGSGGGILGSLASGVAGLFAGAAGGQYAGGTGPAFGSFRAAQEAHSGGVIGSDRLPLRYVHPAVFDDAPRLHTGYMPDEFPAILKKKEGVFTPAQMAALAPVGSAAPAPAPAGDMIVNIQNNAPNATVSAEQQGDGKLLIRVEEKLADSIEQGRLGRSVDKRVRSSFGLTERLVGR